MSSTSILALLGVDHVGSEQTIQPYVFLYLRVKKTKRNVYLRRDISMASIFWISFEYCNRCELLYHFTLRLVKLDTTHWSWPTHHLPIRLEADVGHPLSVPSTNDGTAQVSTYGSLTTRTIYSLVEGTSGAFHFYHPCSFFLWVRSIQTRPFRHFFFLLDRPIYL